MNKFIQRLHSIAAKPSRKIIGLMSGTSLDGLDIALCNVTGHGCKTKLELEHFTTVSYDDDFKTEIKSVFAKDNVSLLQLCLLNEWIGKHHAAMINKCLQNWKINPTEVDLLASHGQTIFHAPLSHHGKQKFGNGTLQIGDGDQLAVLTGIITISDFRQKHIAAGGEGAPLAAYGDYLLFKEEDTDVILLNIGGIANFTFLPAGSATSGMFSTDTGPGNTLMDGWMQQNFKGRFYDEGAEIAEQGTVNELLLGALLDDVFFQTPVPKTTGPELFSLNYLNDAMVKSNTQHLPVADVMATLNLFTAETICLAIMPALKQGAKIYLSGGGMHNPLLIKHLAKKLKGVTLLSTEEKNINPDAKEAILFAILANECVSGNAENFVSGLSNFPAVSMGKISLPG